MNGYCAKLASNFDSKVGLLTLSDPRRHKKCVFFNFHDFDFTAPLRMLQVKHFSMLVFVMFPKETHCFAFHVDIRAYPLIYIFLIYVVSLLIVLVLLRSSSIFEHHSFDANIFKKLKVPTHTRLAGIGYKILYDTMI